MLTSSPPGQAVMKIVARGDDQGGEINSALVELQYLEYLDLSLNDFQRIPRTLDNMICPKALPWLLNVSTNLVYFSPYDFNIYQGHPLSSYFEYLGTSLEYIDLSLNHLNGGIPKSWGDFCSLKTLRLFTYAVPLHDLLGSLTGCAADSLDILDLRFSGGLIPDVKIFPSLKELYLPNYNQLDGPFPNSLCQLSKLLVLNLENNLLTGPLHNLSNMSSLRELNLANNNNKLNNTLTESIGKLSYLKVPDLSPNTFTENLFELNLENNKLFGVIPHSLGSAEYLETSRLSRNNFTGPLPSSLKKCTFLRVLDVGENNLKGKIPTGLGERLTDLVVLRLKSNKFYGTMPPSLCPFRWIQELDVSLNNMPGAIPHAYTISIVNGDNIGYLKVIDLSSNRLTGEIPREMENLVRLVQLKLSRNNLNEAIPEKIGQLNNLDSLDLFRNQLSGNIPESLATICYLDYLDLSNNNLSGRIPIGTQLQSFNASWFAGNHELCGKPLTTFCPGDESLDSGGDDESNVEDGREWCDMSWYWMGIEVGCAVGFCGVCGNLWLNTSWGLAYFQFMNNLGDWLHVLIVVNWAKLKRSASVDKSTNNEPIHQSAMKKEVEKWLQVFVEKSAVSALYFPCNVVERNLLQSPLFSLWNRSFTFVGVLTRDSQKIFRAIFRSFLARWTRGADEQRPIWLIRKRAPSQFMNQQWNL
ncbi:hypothetical protein TIFTF001_049969, partial [Ficus carica]